jgi:predicted transcriptional regulator
VVGPSCAAGYANIGPMAATRPAPILRDSILDAIDRAPIGEPFTPDQLAELDQAMADIAAGTAELVPHEDVPAWLEAHARALGALAE